jgi:hypothetical protein
MAERLRSDEELVAGYWQHYRLSTGDRGERLAQDELIGAWQSVDDLISERDVDAVALLVALADAVEGDEPALAYLGAGPVETLLRSGPLHGGVIAALDAAATDSSSLQIALRCVWWSDDDDPGLRQRFSRFGPPL